MRRRSAITPPTQWWERDAPCADARSTNASVLIACSLSIHLPLRQALRVHRARAVPLIHRSAPTKKGACRLFLDETDSPRPHEGPRPLRPQTYGVSHNACIRWKVLHGAGAVWRNRAKNVAIVHKSSGCGADVPPRVVHAATRVPPPAGEARSRLLHPGTCSVEVDIVAVFHAPENRLLHPLAALEQSR
jgi:hypothetical protein